MVNSSIPVLNSALYSVGQILLVDRELLKVVSIDTPTAITATRGWLGSSIEEHHNLTPIFEVLSGVSIYTTESSVSKSSEFRVNGTGSTRFHIKNPGELRAFDPIRVGYKLFASGSFCTIGFFMYLRVNSPIPSKDVYSGLDIGIATVFDGYDCQSIILASGALEFVSDGTDPDIIPVVMLSDGVHGLRDVSVPGTVSTVNQLMQAGKWYWVNVRMNMENKGSLASDDTQPNVVMRVKDLFGNDVMNIGGTIHTKSGYVGSLDSGIDNFFGSNQAMPNYTNIFVGLSYTKDVLEEDQVIGLTRLGWQGFQPDIEMFVDGVEIFNTFEELPIPDVHFQNVIGNY